MKSSASFAASAAAILFSGTVSADNLYTKNSPVLQVSGKTYNSLIAKSNHTTIIEFYAPWCGHCQNLKPAYEKAAKKLKGLAKVAAVNCDQDANKQFCGEMGIKGFPTLKIIRPSKKTGRPTIEEYQGQRTAKALVDAVVEKIPNHVKRITDKSLDVWLKSDNETAKAVLFTDKGTTSALLRALAIDFLGSISFGQIRNKEASAIETFGVSKYPTLILLPGGDKESIIYSGQMNKDGMSDFLSQIAAPNPDPAPEKASTKPQKKTKIPKPVGEEDSKETGSAQKSEESKKDTPPQPIIPPINTSEELKKKCFQWNSKLCALVLLPNFDPAKDKVPGGMIESLRNMGIVYDKHAKRRTSLQFYLVEPSLPIVAELRKDLNLKPQGELDLIAVNSKKGWFRKFTFDKFTQNNVETWVDAIRMNEGKKDRLPEEFIVPEPAAEEPKEEKKAEEQAKEEDKKKPHDEL